MQDSWHPAALRAKAALVLRTPRERSAELLGSLLLAPLIAAVLIAVVTVIRGEHVKPELLAWQWAVAGVGLCLTLLGSAAAVAWQLHRS